MTRAFGTETRGLHPQLLLLDDVVSDQNTWNEYQRGKTWKHFVETLTPMNPDRVLIVGTALHPADLLHRLRPQAGLGDPVASAGTGMLDFAWRRYRALNEKDGTTLWPSRFPPAAFAGFRDREPIAFSREYQNDPRNDEASLFPHDLIQQAIDAGASMSMVAWYRADVDEIVFLGADLARSERIGADYTVAIVVAYNTRTGQRRILNARRHRGLDFEQQVNMFTDIAVSYGVTVGVIENNGFQGWLVDELRKRPGGHVFFGHTTGRGKVSLDDGGIPMLKVALIRGLWVVPSADAESRKFAGVLQSELGAFGWRDGRLEGVGEHDDVVIALWYVELAIQWYERNAPPEYDYYTLEDLGIEPVVIGEPY